MPSEQPINPAPPTGAVLPGSALRALQSGPTDRSTEWLRLRRDRYIPAEVWRSLSDAQQLRLKVQLVADAAEAPIVISDNSAATVWEIPVIGRLPGKVECVVDDGRRGRSPGVIRHRSQNPPAGVLHDGVRVTPPARTAVDLARRRSLACGVAALDDVLHRGLATYADVVREREAIPKGGRGRQRARLAVALADGLSESAGESLSRVRLFELGYRRPVLQREFFDDNGIFVARTDMYWEDDAMIGEFDGKVKYRVTEDAGPDEASRILWREKRREDALRRLGPGVARWVWEDALHPERLHRILLSHGLRPRVDPAWLERF